jgi:hypothetical protein
MALFRKHAYFIGIFTTNSYGEKKCLKRRGKIGSPRRPRFAGRDIDLQACARTLIQSGVIWPTHTMPDMIHMRKCAGGRGLSISLTLAVLALCAGALLFDSPTSFLLHYFRSRSHCPKGRSQAWFACLRMSLTRDACPLQTWKHSVPMLRPLDREGCTAVRACR